MQINSKVSNNPQLNSIQQKQETLAEQLSSGLKINKAKDDAAGLQLSNDLLSQINGTSQAIRNANDSISYAQVADAALSGVTDVAFRIEELSLQAANGTLGGSERKAIQQEISQLQGQISDTLSQTRFGDQQVFGQSSQFQVGADPNQTIDLAVGTSSLASIDVTTQAGAQQALDTVKTFREDIDSSRVSLGAFQNRVSSTISNLENINKNTQASRSQIVDTDYAKSITDKTATDIQSQAAVALQAQANISNSQVLKLLN